MSADWKKVAANRLKEVRQLRLQLHSSREELATRAVAIVQQEIHSRCLTSISGKEWAEAFDVMKRRIGELR